MRGAATFLALVSPSASCYVLLVTHTTSLKPFAALKAVVLEMPTEGQHTTITVDTIINKVYPLLTKASPPVPRVSCVYVLPS
jgi:hypothetical protein